MMGFRQLLNARLVFVVAGILFFISHALSQSTATITYTQDFPGSDPKSLHGYRQL